MFSGSKNEMYFSEFEYLKDLSPRCDCRAFIWRLPHNQKCLIEIYLEFGLYKYIDKEKKVKKNYRKNAFSEHKTPKTAFYFDFRFTITKKIRHLEYKFCHK